MAHPPFPIKLRTSECSVFTKPQFRVKMFLKKALPGDAPGIGGNMKRFAAFLSLLRALWANCAAGEEKMRPMEIINSILTNLAIRRFLEKRGILTEDKEACNYTNAFLTAAVEKDRPAMKALFAPNAVSEIGEVTLDEMLNAFTDYFEVDSFTLEEPIGPNTSENINHGKRSKELIGREIVTAGTREYRIALRCISRDDWEPGNIGLWSLYIIDAAVDTSDAPYLGGPMDRTGIFFDVPRSR